MDDQNGQGGADLYITDQCGFGCRHCFLGNELNAGGQMSVEMVHGIASFLKSAGFGEAALLGGEPFQHRDIVEIAREVGAAGLRCRIVTNGYRHAHKVLRFGLLPRDVEITFSVDGGREVHDAIRRGGSHSQLADTSRLAREMGYATSGILSVSTENVGEIERVFALCEDVGYDRLTVHHVTARGNASRESVLGQAGWRAVLETIQRLAATTRLQIRCEDPFFTLEPTAPLRCAVRDKSNMMFFPDGRVYSCLLFIDSKGGSGSYWDGKSVVRVTPPRGEFNACLEAGKKPSCPASAVLQPPLYPGGGVARIRCIYDKVPLGPALPT